METCFGCGKDNPDGLHLRGSYKFAEDGDVVIETTVPEKFAGFRGVVHGGIVATMIDEAIGIHASETFRQGHVTAELQVKYRAPVPTNSIIEIRARGTRGGNEDRKVSSTAEIRDESGKLLAEGQGVLVFPKEKS